MNESKHASTGNQSKSPAQELLTESMKISDDAAQLATIRDILFGNQAKDIEQQQQTLHQDFQHGLTALKKETRAQFEQISADIETLYRLLNDESGKQQADNSEANKRIDQLKSSLDESNTKHINTQNALEQKIKREAERVDQQVRDLDDEISAKLELAAKQLKSDKTDRTDLAKMLRGVAEQLSDEQQK